MEHISQVERDRIRCGLYQEFYDTHQELFEKNIRDYWKRCIGYVEREFRNRIKEFEENRKKEDRESEIGHLEWLVHVRKTAEQEN